MPFGVNARHPAVLAAFLVVFCVAFGTLAWQLSARSAPRPLRSWSGTISSGAPTSTPESPAPPIVTIEFAQTDLLAELNRYWLGRINGLRAEKGLRALRTDERLTVTAGEWAGEMASRRDVTHVRLDGKTMHQWIDTKGLPFTEHGAEGGWRTNYFVENIARFYAEPTAEDMRRALDETLGWFLAEGPGGDHYESIYHPDWNSVGVGYAFDPVERESRVYFVFHYGSLK